MKAHNVTVINRRTRGVAPMMGNFSDEDSNHHASSDESVESDDGELYRFEIINGKKVFTESRPDPNKGKRGVKGKTDKMFPLWMHWSHPSRLQRQNSYQWETSKICASMEKCWKLRGRRNRDLTNCAVGNH